MPFCFDCHSRSALSNGRCPQHALFHWMRGRHIGGGMREARLPSDDWLRAVGCSEDAIEWMRIKVLDARDTPEAHEEAWAMTKARLARKTDVPRLEEFFG